MPSYQIAVSCEVNGDDDAIQNAFDDLRNFMTPAPRRQIEEWIARLSVVSAKRRDDEFSEELRIEEYTSRLSRYPADVVRTVLLELTHKFFPSWDELHRRCEALTSPRRHMIAALERGPEPQPKPRREATQEEKDRIQAMINEMFPAISKEMRTAAVNEALKGKCMRDDAE